MPRGIPMPPLLPTTTPLGHIPLPCSSTRRTRSLWHGRTTDKSSSGAMPLAISQPRFSPTSHLLWSLFVTSDEQIFADNGNTNHRVDRWTPNGTTLASPMSTCSRCSGLFVDGMDNLYCSQVDGHQVVRRSLVSSSTELTIVAGIGCSGSTPNMLNYPEGIFVTTDLDLYVADGGNNRVQLFRRGETNATTVAGNGSNGTIALSNPTGVVLDGNGYLFIVDSWNHRIVGEGRGGFRCVVGCSGSPGSASDQLSSPSRMSFDLDGNIYRLRLGQQSN